MTSLLEMTPEQQPLECETPPTEMISMHKPKQVNDPLYSDVACCGLTNDNFRTRKAHSDVGYRHVENLHMTVVNRQPCLDEINSFNFKASPSVVQPLLCAAELQNAYPTQSQSIWGNAGNNVGVDYLNGGYYQPTAMYHAECREGGYPAVLRSMEKPVNLLTNSNTLSKLWNGEQRPSCSLESQLVQIGAQNSPNKRYSSESEANSFRHALIHPYFSWDELRFQPVSYPRHSPYENMSSGNFMGRFPTQMHPYAAQPRPMPAAQPRPMPATQPRPMPAAQLHAMPAEIAPMTSLTNSNQYLASVPSAHAQQQVMPSLIPGDISTQGFSHLLDGPLNCFQPHSFNQFIREIQPNPSSADCEGIQPSNWRISSNGFRERDDSNLRKLSDVCATSDPFSRALNVLENGKINHEDRKCGMGSDLFSHINLGPAMSSEGLSHDSKGFPRSCKLYLRRGTDISDHGASGSCAVAENAGEFSSKGSDFSSISEIDVVGGDCSVTASVPLVLPKRRTRTGEEHCECPVCGRKLARASTLKIHMRQHTGDRPFKCVTCGKTFAQAGLLQSHRRTHTGERPFSCVHCRKKFAHSGALKTHVRTHTGERPHKCPAVGCNLAFGDSSTLSKHTRIHTGERPYCCDICGKRFTQSGNMHKHKKCVHNAARKSFSTKQTSGFSDHRGEKDKSTDGTPVEKLLLA